MTEEEQEEIIIPKDKYLKIGKIKYKIWICSRRLLEAKRLYNEAVEGMKKDPDKYTEYDCYTAFIDVAMILIKQDFRIYKIVEWVKCLFLTKKMLLNNFEMEELKEFLDEALEPLIGAKKKDLERQEKMEDIMIKVVDKVGIEAFTQLLLNYAQDVDIKKAM